MITVHWVELGLALIVFLALGGYVMSAIQEDEDDH